MYKFSNEAGWAIECSELIHRLSKLREIYGDRPIVFIGKNDKGIFYEGVTEIRVTTNDLDAGFHLKGNGDSVFYQERSLELNFIGRLLKNLIFKK